MTDLELSFADWLVHIARAPQHHTFAVLSTTLDTAEHNVLQPMRALSNPAAVKLNRGTRTADVFGHTLIVLTVDDLERLHAVRGLELHGLWIDPDAHVSADLMEQLDTRLVQDNAVWPR